MFGGFTLQVIWLPGFLLPHQTLFWYPWCQVYRRLWITRFRVSQWLFIHVLHRTTVQPHEMQPPQISITTENMAQSAIYKQCSTTISSYLGESDYSVLDDCHMLEPSNPRKRLHSAQKPSQLPSKKQKLINHPSGSHLPPAFYDNLSKIHLTRDALKELDRRNTQSVPPSHHSLYRRSHRPITRQTVAHRKEKEDSWKPTQPIADFLTRSVGRLQEIKLFARHGGPDLSDLRGVCMCC